MNNQPADNSQQQHAEDELIFADDDPVASSEIKIEVLKKISFPTINFLSSNHRIRKAWQ